MVDYSKFNNIEDSDEEPIWQTEAGISMEALLWTILLGTWPVPEATEPGPAEGADMCVWSSTEVRGWLWTWSLANWTGPSWDLVASSPWRLLRLPGSSKVPGLVAEGSAVAAGRVSTAPENLEDNKVPEFQLGPWPEYSDQGICKPISVVGKGMSTQSTSCMNRHSHGWRHICVLKPAPFAGPCAS